MKIRRLVLYTNTLDVQKSFYTKTLGIDLLDEGTDFISIDIGWTELIFKRSEKEHKYHYCFLIPSNKLEESLDWLEERTDVIEIERGRKTQKFESWNAESIYFYDGGGNLAEFIVRYDLKNASNSLFNSKQLLCVNEIGLPTADVVKTNSTLEQYFGTSFWKGDKVRFGTNGSQEGLILLPNYEVKKLWFPTSMTVRSEPFSALIENDGNMYVMEFDGEVISVSSKVDNL